MRYKAIEAQIRRWLVEQGYAARTAPFEEVTLAAIERPGWVQVYRFRIAVRAADGNKLDLHGAIRDDGRFGAKFHASESAAERDAVLDSWIGEFGPAHPANAEPRPRWLIGLLLAGVAALVLLALLSR